MNNKNEQKKFTSLVILTVLILFGAIVGSGIGFIVWSISLVDKEINDAIVCSYDSGAYNIRVIESDRLNLGLGPDIDIEIRRNDEIIYSFDLDDSENLKALNLLSDVDGKEELICRQNVVEDGQNIKVENIVESNDGGETWKFITSE